MDLEYEYRCALFRISKILLKEDVIGIVFILDISGQDAEKIQGPLDVLKYLETRDFVNMHKFKGLRTLMKAVLPEQRYLQTKYIIRNYVDKYREVYGEDSGDLSPTCTPVGPQLDKLQKMALEAVRPAGYWPGERHAQAPHACRARSCGRAFVCEGVPPTRAWTDSREHLIPPDDGARWNPSRNRTSDIRRLLRRLVDLLRGRTA